MGWASGRAVNYEKLAALFVFPSKSLGGFTSNTDQTKEGMMLAPELVIALTVAIALIFVLLSVWYVRRETLTVEDYVVSRNSAGVILATASLVASGLGAWISFSPAETGATSGIVALVGYGIGSALPLAALSSSWSQGCGN